MSANLRGGVERIGSPESRCLVQTGDHRQELVAQVPDHAVAVQMCLKQLADPESGCLKTASEVSAIGFKAVHGGTFSGVQRVNEAVLSAMEKMNRVAPAHNPPYIAAMRQMNEKLPGIPLVAAFETGFHATIPLPSAANVCGAIRLGGEASDPPLGVSRGKSSVHRHAHGGADRVADEMRMISCHLGRIEFTVCDSRRKERRNQHGNESAIGIAAEQSRRRFRSVCNSRGNAGDRQIARAGARRSGRAKRVAGFERHKRRCPRFGTSGCRRQRTSSNWRSTCSSAACGIT